MADPALDKERDAPSFKILIGGQELPVEASLDVLDVKVSAYVEGASAFTIKFNNRDSYTQDLKYIDGDLLVEGAKVEIKVGYVDQLKSLIAGEVTAIEPEFSENEAPALKIHGYDLLHRFRRGRKTRSFTKMKDSEIAEKIARELQLRAEAEDTQITHDYVLQSNQTDIDFLLERARRIRYEVVIKDKTLHFRKAANNKGKVITLEFGLTLKSFYPRLNTLGQVSEVLVQGWDPKTKKAIAGKAREGDEISKMQGAKLGAAISENAFAAAQTIIVDHPIFSEGEANQIAIGKFNEMTVGFITGEGAAIGNADITAGEVIELKGLGQRFSGLYYVTSATHIVNAQGYNTKFTVARNAT
jgi:phage protein D